MPGPAGHFATKYTGGMVTTWKRFSQTYGRFEVRARMPGVTVPGIHSAIWLWRQDPAKRGGKPTSGEIDIAEYYSVNPDRLIPYVHDKPAATDPNVTNSYCLVEDPSAWHDYLLTIGAPTGIGCVAPGRHTVTDPGPLAVVGDE